MPWPHGHPDAYLDRAIPGHHPDPPIPAREIDRTLSKAVLLAPPGTRSDSSEQPIPLAGPGLSRPHPHTPGLGRSIHVGRSKDVHSPICRRQAGPDQPDDAVDDATDVDLLLLSTSQWPCPVLGGIQPDSNGYSILYYRLGKPAPIQKASASPRDWPRPTGQGGCARWRHWK